MRVLLQRVLEASVKVDGTVVSSIGPGLLVFLGVEPNDTEREVSWLVDKTLSLRIFPDELKPMNRSVTDVGGEVLVVSQFTLAANTDKGRRPTFHTAAPPELAQALYEKFAAVMREKGQPVAMGSFGADMQVALVNDGPATFLLERSGS